MECSERPPCTVIYNAVRFSFVSFGSLESYPLADGFKTQSIKLQLYRFQSVKSTRNN